MLPFSCENDERLCMMHRIPSAQQLCELLAKNVWGLLGHLLRVKVGALSKLYELCIRCCLVLRADIHVFERRN